MSDNLPPIKPEPPSMRIGDNTWQEICDVIADTLGYDGAAKDRESAMNMTDEDRKAQNEYSELTSAMVVKNMAEWASYDDAMRGYRQAMTRWRTVQAARSPETAKQQVQLEADLLLDPDTPNAIRADLAAKPEVMDAVRARFATIRLA